jgi:hypothetical protein
MANGDPWMYNNINLAGGNGVWISGPSYNGGAYTIGLNPEIMQMIEEMKIIKKRLCILDAPDLEKLEKYKALKEAYDAYLLIEKLIGEND